MAKKARWPTVEELGEDFQQISAILEGESDRGLVLVSAAFLDDMLTALLHKKFVDDEKVVERLLGRERPLDRFSAKIDLAYCLGLLHHEVWSDLHQIREIRNRFAHMRITAAFADDWVKDKCGVLHSAAAGRSTTSDPARIARGRFLVATALLLGVLHMTAAEQRHAVPIGG